MAKKGRNPSGTLPTVLRRVKCWSPVRQQLNQTSHCGMAACGFSGTGRTAQAALKAVLEHQEYVEQRRRAEALVAQWNADMARPAGGTV